MKKVELKERMNELKIGLIGWCEPEDEVVERALEAYELGSMEPLVQPLFYEPIYYADLGCRCDMTAEEVVELLKEKGIWQLVEEAILTKEE